MPLEIVTVPCLRDNYAYLLRDGATGQVGLVDAPEPGPIEAALGDRGWKLDLILITHHHADHIDGVDALRKRYRARAAGAAADKHRLPALDVELKGGDTIAVGESVAQVFEAPGHTVGHIAYWFRSAKVLFAADTLFSLGCGRVFEGTMADMWGSLRKLRDLPDDTQLYCGHEYTLSNARFALTVDPDNAALKRRFAEVEAQRSAHRFTLPVTLGAEKKENPFLRADDPAIARHLGLEDAGALAVFTELRERKNRA